MQTLRHFLGLSFHSLLGPAHALGESKSASSTYAFRLLTNVMFKLRLDGGC
jgi:hypothetical protein